MMQTHEERFWENLCDLFSLLYEIIQEGYEKKMHTTHPSTVEFLKKLIERTDREVLIQQFIVRSVVEDKQGKRFCIWDSIVARDAQCLLKHMNRLFFDLEFRIFEPAFERSEDREAIWSYLDSLIRISLKYIAERNFQALDPAWVEKYRAHYKL